MNDMKKYTAWLAVLTVASLLLVSCDYAGEGIPLLNGSQPESDTTDTAIQTTPVAPGGESSSDAETTAPPDIIEVPDSMSPFPILSGGPAVTLPPIQLSDIEDIAFHPTRSYAKDGYIYLRADYLGMTSSGSFYFAEEPTYLTIRDYDGWQAFLNKADGDEGIRELAQMDQAFFTDHALILLFPAGISGSAHYRVDKVMADGGRLSVTLATVSPNAATLDLVHWCVAVPVEKQHAELPVELISHNAQIGEAETPVVYVPSPKPREK